MADGRRLLQVLVNLLINPVKFTQEGGNVSLCAERTETHRLKIVVMDDGPGMIPRSCDISLTRFGQVHEKIDQEAEGAGLGLPLSKELVEGHGGKFWIESQPRAGARVIIELPVS